MIENNCVVWLTGLSGAGKTTIAKALVNDFKMKGRLPILLDGDEIRNLFQKTGFDEEARKKHNLEVGKLAAFFEKQGHLVIVSLISPYEETRKEIRKLCKNYFEIYVATSLETCIKRDVKGLYQKALSGEISQFTGISSPYEIPEKPNLILETENVGIEQCVQHINQILNKY